MRRREFITLIGGAAAWPLAARAQQPAMPVIGFVSAGSPQGYERVFAAFLKGLDETGYVEGHNVAIQARWAEGRNDRLPSLVADLVQRKVNVIAATTTPAALAAKAATATIPVVFTTIADPVQIGLVTSLNRPGGNMTGVTLLSVELGPKLFELLHDSVPKATIMALLVNPTNPNLETQSRNLQVAALKLGLQPRVVNASTERNFDAVFAKLHELRADALMISQDPFFNIQSEQLGALSVRHAIPAIYVNREFAAAGGLMSYGANRPDEWRQAGVYVDRILKGEKPADLPVQAPTKSDTLPSGSDWLHEIKHDGFRIIPRKTGARVRLYSRPGNDLTRRFPLIVETLARLRSRSCIIDGEAVACDDNGVASFDLVRHHRANDSVFLYAFDLIELNGDDLRRDPLEVRKATLASIVAKASPGIRFNEHIEGDGATVFAHACKLDLEGIVSK